MAYYSIIKGAYMLTACVTAVLMILRLTLDAAGWTGWRQTPLRWIPHVNDTVLLTAALVLVWVTPWMPLVHHWLTAQENDTTL